MPSCASYCHFPHPESASSPMNRGPLHAGKEGSGTLGGKAGRSRDGNSWYWHPLLLCAITWVLSLSPVSSFAVSPAIPSNRLPPQSPPPPTQASPPAHSITTIESRLACGVSASTASQVAGGMCVQLGDSLDTAGSAETAAILLTGGFVEMAWTAWTAWCYLGPPCRRPPCRVLQ
jgi:hypothetical protein